MNAIVNKLLLGGDKFMPELDLRQSGITNSTSGSSNKNKERIKNLKKQEIQDIFIKMNQIKSALNMTQLMDILKIYLEEQDSFR